MQSMYATGSCQQIGSDLAMGSLLLSRIYTFNTLFPYPFIPLTRVLLLKQLSDGRLHSHESGSSNLVDQLLRGLHEVTLCGCVP